MDLGSGSCSRLATPRCTARPFARFFVGDRHERVRGAVQPRLDASWSHQPVGRAHALTGSDMAIIAGRLAYILDLGGAVLVSNTACSSSIVARHRRCAPRKGVRVAS